VAAEPGRQAASAWSWGGPRTCPFPDATFEALTFTYLLRYVADPAATLRELVRVVKPGGGAIASLEFHPPRGVLWHPLWLPYYTPCRLAASRLGT
jgi:demethylmenaquinone methyltransferase/2-methoxy-6-polyprenyl-1,4-benzoquinol methylase